jgi:hypothetical protein
MYGFCVNIWHKYEEHKRISIPNQLIRGAYLMLGSWDMST